MKSIAVFCGSSDGASPIYLESAVNLGKELARQKITLVYGGASIGLMGAVARTVLEEGGQAIGVIPSFLEKKEISYHELTELIVVDSMHERKAKMAELADGFISLPGGAGTMEEFFEVFTWAQLGLHRKPLGLLNVNHYYDRLIEFINHMADEQFLQDKFREMAIMATDPQAMIEQFRHYIAPETKQFITKKEQV